MYQIIPFPNQIEYNGSQSILSKSMTIWFDSNVSEIKEYILSTLKNEFEIIPSDATIEHSASLKFLFQKTLNKNQYLLLIKDNAIIIKASTNKAFFYGFQTLRQIMFQTYDPHANHFLVKDIKVLDSPRFQWRGFMLDEGRYFLGKMAVKKVLDWMALLKLNKFHWHLTEDQGWRIQIDRYPKLTEIGSKRNGTPLYRNINKQLDGKEHSGYYTKEDIKEIIKYATSRFIDIIPEIEMPGHAVAALAAYPQFSCTGGPFNVSNKWGIHRDVFCLGNPTTTEFLKNILLEVVDLFPFEYLHTGGDEVPKDRWSKCPKCQEAIKKGDLKDEHGLQVKFTNEIVDFLGKLGKKTIVWNELTDDRLDTRTVIQFWKGSFDSIMGFLKKGGTAVLSPSNYYYVDLRYHKTSLSKCYNYEPLPQQYIEDIGASILGIEAELWGEVFNSESKMEYCAFPRVLAIAESAWTEPKNKDFKRFISSIPVFESILKIKGINYTPLKNAEPNWFQTFKDRFKKGFGTYL